MILHNVFLSVCLKTRNCRNTRQFATVLLSILLIYNSAMDAAVIPAPSVVSDIVPKKKAKNVVWSLG